MSVTDALDTSSADRELMPYDVAPSASLGEALGTAGAWVGLLLVDTVARLAGFRRFHRLVRALPTVGTRRAAEQERHVERLCAAVDRASTSYFRRAWCLQRSATTACLLRLRGYPAEMVIGVRKMPFYAHAWVELDGRVVNDRPLVREHYTVIERC